MDTLKRVQFLSQHYAALQGLKHVPVWAVALSFGVFLVLGTKSMPLPTIAMLLFVLCLVVSPFAYFVIRGYYNRRFGYAQMRPNSQEVAFSVLLTIGVLLDQQFNLSISIFAFFAALYFLYYWRKAPDLLQHYLISALVMALFGLLIGLIPMQDRMGSIMIFTSLVNLTASIWDHVLLVRLVGHSSKETSYG